jgi:hypothetical protein
MSQITSETDKLNVELKRLLENADNEKRISHKNDDILKVSLSIAQT